MRAKMVHFVPQQTGWAQSLCRTRLRYDVGKEFHLDKVTCRECLRRAQDGYLLKAPAGCPTIMDALHEEALRGDAARRLKAQDAAVAATLSRGDVIGVAPELDVRLSGVKGVAALLCVGGEPVALNDAQVAALADALAAIRHLRLIAVAS